jgi:predicted hydrocarbon binding protein
LALGFGVEVVRLSDKQISGVVRDIDGERLICIKGKVMQAIRSDLGNILGPNVVKEIFYRIGINAASIAHEQLKDVLTSERELWSMADRVTRLQGWGRIRRYEKAFDGQRLVVRVILEDSPFAEGIVSREPVCDIARGGLGKLIALYYGMTLLKSVEVQCCARGSPFCELLFELGPRPTTPILPQVVQLTI